MQVHDEHWIRYFRMRGYPDVEPLATGMEGAVYRLKPGLVAKVWGGEKSHTELLTLRRFYDQLARQSLPFATPEMLEVENVEGTAVTIEKELLGRPLQEHLSETDEQVSFPAEECLATVIEALGSAVGVDSALALPVLGEPTAFRGDANWLDALIALLDRRVGLFGDRLTQAVPAFGDLYDLITRSLSTMEVTQTAVIHGDICGVNILVDDELKPTALLDWGFLSTDGDPAFDASVAAGIFNMFGEHAQAIDTHLLGFLAGRLGVPIDRLLVYRAAYAVATSNAYDPTGSDGHFAWCAAALRRADIRAALHRSANE